MTDEHLIAFEAIKADIASGFLHVGSEVTLVVGHSGQYDSFEELYGKKGVIDWISASLEPEEEVFKIEFGDKEHSRNVSVFFSEISYPRRGQNPLADHFRKLINVE